MLSAQAPLPPGMYPISLVITDRQNQQCDTPDNLAVEVCQCDNRDTCRAVPQPGPRYGDQPSGRLGPDAIGLLLLGLLMLLREYPHASSVSPGGGGGSHCRSPCTAW